MVRGLTAPLQEPIVASFLSHWEEWVVPLGCARRGTESCELGFIASHLSLVPVKIGIPVAQKRGGVCGWASLTSIALVFTGASFLYRRN
jgi:hypothetical protein